MDGAAPAPSCYLMESCGAQKFGSLSSPLFDDRTSQDSAAQTAVLVTWLSLKILRSPGSVAIRWVRRWAAGLCLAAKRGVYDRAFMHPARAAANCVVLWLAAWHSSALRRLIVKAPKRASTLAEKWAPSGAPDKFSPAALPKASAEPDTSAVWVIHLGWATSACIRVSPRPCAKSRYRSSSHSSRECSFGSAGGPVGWNVSAARGPALEPCRAWK
jgi:hypothetical protein